MRLKSTDKENALDLKALALGSTDTPRRRALYNITTILKFKKASKRDQAVIVPSHYNIISPL